MISCSISNFKSNADNEDHLKSLSVVFFTCTPLIRNEYLFYGNRGLKLPSDLAIYIVHIWKVTVATSFPEANAFYQSYLHMVC